MKPSYKIGLGFGLTSGIITTLGLMVGLQAGTNSKLVVLGGILTIAIADGLSDALGIHISQETQDNHKDKEVWEATVSTLLSKIFFALTFLVPVLLFELKMAIFVSIAWAFLLIGFFSFLIAKKDNENPLPLIVEHFTITLLVVFATHFIGDFVSQAFS